jgi:hypothetical protein
MREFFNSVAALRKGVLEAVNLAPDLLAPAGEAAVGRRHGAASTPSASEFAAAGKPAVVVPAAENTPVDPDGQDQVELSFEDES